MSKSNSDITSKKLMKQRLDALIKAGDAFIPAIAVMIRDLPVSDEMCKWLAKYELAWHAAKKAIRP